MIGRAAFFIIPLAGGIILGSVMPQFSDVVRSAIGFLSGAAPLQAQNSADEDKLREDAIAEKAGILRLTERQIADAQIEVSAVGAGRIVRRIPVAGTIVPDADRIARVAVKVPGTIAELRKKLGDPVAKGEVLAILDSREFADAKSEYLAAKLTHELQQDLFERDRVLWEKHVSNEQQFLKSRNQAAHAKMRLDITHQKLVALGLSMEEIAALPREPEASLHRQEVRSPMGGRVVERKVDIGTVVGRDNLETELFVVVDLDSVWVELIVSPADLSLVKEGQSVSISSRAQSTTTAGTIVFISPLLDKETRSARVVAAMPNRDGLWRPGSFVTASIAVEDVPVKFVLPVGAVQTIDDHAVAFVRTADGFAKREVVLGRHDGQFEEIVAGLQEGDRVAVTNTFALKAELMKASAED